MRTYGIALYDGNNQAPRQDGPDTGPAESGTVQIETSAGAHVPSLENIIRVTITPN